MLRSSLLTPERFTPEMSMVWGCGRIREVGKLN